MRNSQYFGLMWVLASIAAGVIDAGIFRGIFILTALASLGLGFYFFVAKEDVLADLFPDLPKPNSAGGTRFHLLRGIKPAPATPPMPVTKVEPPPVDYVRAEGTKANEPTRLEADLAAALKEGAAAQPADSGKKVAPVKATVSVESPLGWLSRIPKRWFG